MRLLRAGEEWLGASNSQPRGKGSILGASHCLNIAQWGVLAHRLGGSNLDKPGKAKEMRQDAGSDAQALLVFMFSLLVTVHCGNIAKCF